MWGEFISYSEEGDLGVLYSTSDGVATTTD